MLNAHDFVLLITSNETVIIPIKVACIMFLACVKRCSFYIYKCYLKPELVMEAWLLSEAVFILQHDSCWNS